MMMKMMVSVETVVILDVTCVSLLKVKGFDIGS